MKYSEKVNIIASLGFLHDLSSFYYRDDYAVNIVTNCIYYQNHTYKFKSFEDMMNFLYVNLPLSLPVA